MLKKVIFRVHLLLALAMIFSLYYTLNVYAQPDEDDYKLIRTIKNDTTGDEISDVVKYLQMLKIKAISLKLNIILEKHIY